MKKLIALVLMIVSLNINVYAESEIWELRNFVDAFGDMTEGQYVTNIDFFEGTFSNSATSNSLLLVQFVVSKEEVSFKLYEYGKYIVKPSSYNVYTMQIKNETDGVTEIKVKGAYDRITVTDPAQAEKIGEYLGSNEPVKILITQTKYGVEKYLFEIPDPAPEEMRILLNTITD